MILSVKAVYHFCISTVVACLLYVGIREYVDCRREYMCCYCCMISSPAFACILHLVSMIFSTPYNFLCLYIFCIVVVLVVLSLLGLLCQWTFLPDMSGRGKLMLPSAVLVDYRASCFCHRRLVDVGHVCSVCLSSEL